MHAILGDLTSETVSEALSSPELFNFDIAVVGGGFHHFADPALAAKRREYIPLPSIHLPNPGLAASTLSYDRPVLSKDIQS